MNYSLAFYLLLSAIGGFLAGYFRSYLGKKAENLATKEDIEGITRIVEGVKSDLATNQELIRWELGKRATIHRLAAEKEFEALSEIGKCLFELQQATEELRPTGLQRIDPSESAEDKLEKYRARHRRWAENHDAFVAAVQQKKLFMPSSLYRQFFNIGRLSFNEAIDFETALAYGKGKLSPNSYEQARKNIGELAEAIEAAITSLRQRYGIEE